MLQASHKSRQERGRGEDMKHHISAKTIHMVLTKLNGRGLVLADDEEGTRTWVVSLPSESARSGRVWLRLEGKDLSFHPDRKFWVA